MKKIFLFFTIVFCLMKVDTLSARNFTVINRNPSHVNNLLKVRVEKKLSVIKGGETLTLANMPNESFEAGFCYLGMSPFDSLCSHPLKIEKGNKDIVVEVTRDGAKRKQ